MWYPPAPGMGYPPGPGMGYLPPDMGWGTPQDLGWGTTPQTWDGVPPRQVRIVNTCYAEGGMPLAFTQEDFLVQNDSAAGFSYELSGT